MAGLARCSPRRARRAQPLRRGRPDPGRRRARAPRAGADDGGATWPTSSASPGPACAATSTPSWPRAAWSTRDAPQAGGRKRGRPARQFLLTASGRARAGRGEDGPVELAVAALRTLARGRGRGRGPRLRPERALAMVGDHREHVLAGADRAERAERLAGALTAEGYAATTRGAGAQDGLDARVTGEQLCQHHCPVADVAAEFPAALRGRGRGVRRAAGHPRPAARHDRARRRRVHHPRPGAAARGADQQTNSRAPPPPSPPVRGPTSREGRSYDHRRGADHTAGASSPRRRPSPPWGATSSAGTTATWRARAPSVA